MYIEFSIFSVAWSLLDSSLERRDAAANESESLGSLGSLGSRGRSPSDSSRKYTYARIYACTHIQSQLDSRLPRDQKKQEKTNGTLALLALLAASDSNPRVFVEASALRDTTIPQTLRLAMGVSPFHFRVIDVQK